MRILGKEKIYEFMQKHVDSKDWLKAWLAESHSEEWQSPKDIKAHYRSASILDGNRIIFNVKGNTYRMEVQVSYQYKIIFVKRIGTHAEYTRWDT